MTDLRQAAQQALEFLEGGSFVYPTQLATALREALAQPEQEPVACRFCHSKKGSWAWQCYKCGEIDDVQQPAPLPVQPVHPTAQEMHNAAANLALMKEMFGDANQPAATPQEKMKHKDGIEEEEFYRAWNAGQVRRVSDGKIMNPQIKDAPPQREWVGLTDEEKFEIAAAQYGWEDLLIAAEAALRSKNT